MIEISDISDFSSSVGALGKPLMTTEGEAVAIRENLNELSILGRSPDRESLTWEKIEGSMKESFGGVLKSLGEKIAQTARTERNLTGVSQNGIAVISPHSVENEVYTPKVAEEGDSLKDVSYTVSSSNPGVDSKKVSGALKELESDRGSRTFMKGDTVRDSNTELKTGFGKLNSSEVVKLKNPSFPNNGDVQVGGDEKTSDIDGGATVIPDSAALVAAPMVNAEPVAAVVKTPPSPSVSQIMVAAVEAVVEAMTVSAALTVNESGEIHIQLKNDILDGSFVKLHARNGDLEITVMPASKIAEGIFVKNQEIFQMQLAERVANWRINVGVAAWNARSVNSGNLEDKA